MSIDVARKILEASKQRAKELRSPVSIAIVDAGGHLVLFERMMAPYGWATGDISVAKASTAVMFNQSTDAVAQWGAGIPGFASSLATMTHGKFIMAAGGWPIKINGATVGGIGVSGGNAPGRDDEIARAGLGSLEAYVPPIPAQPPRLAQPVPPMQPQVSPPVNSQQYSRPYMQPSASYPAMPPANNANAPTPLSNSGNFAPAQSNGGNPPTPPSSSGVVQQSNDPLGTQHLFPDQQQQEEYPYNDANSQFNDNRSGGQS